MIEIKVGKLAEIFGVHRNTVSNWIKTGALPAEPRMGKKYAIRREKFIRFLDEKGISRDMATALMGDIDVRTIPEAPEKIQTSIIPKEVPMFDKPVGSVMVVGGGIAGIQASLDLADSGYFVYLLEKSPGIGGGMAKLDKTFPTNDCAM